MMRRRYFIWSVILVLLLVSCGENEYGEFQKALRHQYRMLNEFTIAVAGASGPEDIAAALDRFQKEALAGRELMLELAREHPGLADLDKASLPEDVQAVLEGIEEVTPRFVAALRRIEAEYGRDPEIRKALEGVKAGLSLPPR